MHSAGTISDVSSAVLDNVIKLHVRRSWKSKYHKNKTKHHKDKRKKRRHSKNGEPEDSSAMSVNGSECTGEETPENVQNGSATCEDSSNCEATATVVGSELDAKLKLGVKRLGINTKDVEAATIKTEHVDSVRFINDVNNTSNDTRCNANTGPSVSGEEPNKDTLEDNRTTRLQFNDAATFALPKRVCQNDSSKNAEYPFNTIVNTETAEAQTVSVLNREKTSVESHKDANCDASKDDEPSLNGDDRKLKKKRKKRNEVAQVDENASEKNPLEIGADEVVLKHRRKKHKHTNEHKTKKHHDVRKAPQDGIVVVEETIQDISVPEIESPSSMGSGKVPESADSVISEPQRLAIKIKLCQECNSRHLQDACPLVTPQYTITDTITYEEWLGKHQDNDELIKTMKTNDPMSEGYARLTDEGCDSDDESDDKNKTKMQREERLVVVEMDRPLFARDSLPDCLELRFTNSEHGLGIYAKDPVPMYAKLGPLIGIPIREMDIPDDFSMRHIWEVLSLLCDLLSVLSRDPPCTTYYRMSYFNLSPLKLFYF